MPSTKSNPEAGSVPRLGPSFPGGYREIELSAHGQIDDEALDPIRPRCLIRSLPLFRPYSKSLVFPSTDGWKASGEISE